jgi:hypothetical protein
VLARDLSAAYQSRRQGRAPEWSSTAALRAPEPANPDLTMQWVRHLEGAADIAWLDDSSEGCQGDCPITGHVTSRRLAAEQASALRRWAAARGQSMVGVILAAYTRAVAEHAKGDEFLVGIPTRIRSNSEIDTVDCQINMFCFRTPSGVVDWPDYVGATAAELRWCLPRSTASLRDIRLSLNLSRTGRHPLYQVMFAYQDHPPATLTIGAEARYHRVTPRRAPAEMLLEVLPDADGDLILVGSRQCEHVSERVQQAVLDRTVAQLAQT